MRDAATQRQVDAARPGVSTWLAANAGSGKTRVLTDRVARLLLDGTAPENILCLTYTKAAASEMQNRLFKRLGAWAMLPDDRLVAELRHMGVERDLGRVFLQQARTLFARAIETPGGLRIQTIHSFCASLLRRFPLEARVSPQFREMEDRSAEILRADLLDALASGPDAEVVTGLARHFTGSDEDLDALLRAVVGAKDAFLPPRSPDEIRARYDVPEGLTPEDLLADVILGGEVALLDRVIAAMRTHGGSTDQRNADRLSALDLSDPSSLETLEAVFLTGPGAKVPFAAKPGTVPTKGCQKKAGLDDAMPQIDALMLRLEAAMPRRLALAAATRDTALHRFAQTFLPDYEAAKEARGWLDFDDLIDRTNALLSDPAVADWVLYRLDGGIDHILVDEAQDTSPRQWQVIERLAREFTAGAGARAETPRTIFVVGDKKQSIYSFQGADPREFDRMCDEFGHRLETTGTPLARMTLAHSFRSSAPILDVVDRTFEDRPGSGFVPDESHIAFKSEMPGRVDLWPHVPNAETPEEPAWYEPVDRVSPTHHDKILAARVAEGIAGMIERDTLPVETPHGLAQRPVRPGDILILVRGRGTVFRETIRACKARGLPVAGADRLKVTAELAVKDIAATLSFLSVQEDDLSLAAALRSPFFGWSEQDLFTLAQGRMGRLWEALRRNREAYPATLAILDDLRAEADFLRPYDLIERLLIRHEGRRRLLGRLGPEAEDGIDALLGQALAYEEASVPSLTGFLQWLQTDDLEIKRSPESAGDRIRVMTVHGAKGLEAPVVILPDARAPQTALRDPLLHDADASYWKLSGPKPPPQSAAEDAAKDREAAERDRLLYVAMTRAERWLIVAAAGKLGARGDDWYGQVREGMERAGAAPHAFDFGPAGSGEGLRIGDTWDHLPRTDPPRAEPALPELPERYRDAPPQPVVPVAPRSPSDLGGAKALPGAGDHTEVALARGTALHLLLETLPLVPQGERRAAAARLLPDRTADLAALVAEAEAVLAAPDLAPLFGSEALVEVPLTADVPRLGRLTGVIDRLIVTPERVLAVDFKSNRTVPAAPDQVPEGLLRQMGAYAAMLGAIYPDRPVEVALLWTATAQLMPLPHEMVSAACVRATGS
ncbi:ATP-dependent helicase/nuclease subunit A [Roseivivax jejudonensis]|uniref:DNA 3'-5' helicase n=1 Tax=Roseivivax jejudonensis TaxID=1529041 RepID=A0A1X6YNC8_9RHOB|nr:double-strand break repair helicase AddA [Roseivivax jejudonensis]SLN24563.1 ATP-dependent helicase/nuclease subunit A [Roseivivax jejudonensis]